MSNPVSRQPAPDSHRQEITEQRQRLAQQQQRPLDDEEEE